MLHKFFEDGHWFAAKKFGYGAGLPIAWQGWVLLGGYIVTMAILAATFEHASGAVSIVIVASMVLLTIGLIVVAKRRTEGGWRWRP